MTVTIESKPSSRSKDPASILEHFAALPDPRRDHGKIHLLDEIIFMAICAVLCGADNWLEIAEFAEEWLTSAQAMGHSSRPASARVLPWDQTSPQPTRGIAC